MTEPVAGGLLGPVIVLNLWTFVIETLLYATPAPVFLRLKITEDNTMTRSEMDTKTPASVRWKADNYNHLMEQPIQFYAFTLALAIATGGKADRADIGLAWAYVGIPVLHSLVHVTINHIPTRFTLFIVSSWVLIAMGGRAAKFVF